MSALIYVDLEAVLPVVNGEWHRIDVHRMPMPGEEITMLCGVTDVAEFEDLVRRRGHPVTQCWGCDLVYRRRKGIHVPPDHPGRIPRPTPQQRRKP